MEHTEYFYRCFNAVVQMSVLVKDGRSESAEFAKLNEYANSLRPTLNENERKQIEEFAALSGLIPRPEIVG